jgi:alpha-D-xyloside xylohydrolase
MSVKTGLNMAMCGIPWWNSDIGGFRGGDPADDYFQELIVRWFQFGLFCPVMRLHGDRKWPQDRPRRNPGITMPSSGDNEIWSFGEKAYPILKELIELSNGIINANVLCGTGKRQPAKPFSSTLDR